MPSFDIVSEVDFQEVDNAVNQASKEIDNRFDFRGGKSSISFDKSQKQIQIIADDEMKLRSIHQILEQKFSKRSIDLRSLDYGKEETAGHQQIRQKVSIKVGIEKDVGKRINQLIKSSKLKVQSQLQDDQIRVTGKKIDDLQSVIQLLKVEEIGLPLQFINMRS